jgi:hypothetical protein
MQIAAFGAGKSIFGAEGNIENDKCRLVVPFNLASERKEFSGRIGGGHSLYHHRPEIEVLPRPIRRFASPKSNRLSPFEATNREPEKLQPGHSLHRFLREKRLGFTNAGRRIWRGKIDISSER